ncbi:MAG: hypothetical protein AAFY02_03265 [Pseudomonadota bacterium]
MSARHLPFLIGGFMMVPFVLWLALWLFVLPGPKHGTDLPLTLAMGFVSLPLVAWFLLSSLSMLANSVAGRNEFKRARIWWADKVITLLPRAALLLGFASLPYLAFNETAWFKVPIPFLISMAIAWAIRSGERDRAIDMRSAKGRRLRPVVPAVKAQFVWLGRVLMGLAFKLPILGEMLREGVQGSSRDRGYFFLTLILLAVAAVYFFGYPALITVALGGTLMGFAFILMVARG